MIGKFKVWNIVKKQWESGMFLNSEGMLFDSQFRSVANREDYLVCWDTGVVDQNGEPLYSEDVIKIKERLLLIRFDRGHWLTFMSELRGTTHSLKPFFALFDLARTEKIEKIDSSLVNSELVKLPT